VKRTFAFLILLAGLSLPALWAHHSPSAIFDMTKRATWTGTLTKVGWVNPHITLDIDAENGEKWHFESNPPAWFRRVGIARADFADSIGKKVTLEGVRARDGSHYGYVLRYTFADGHSMELQPDVKGE
jgi:hypothetical protein